MLYDHEITGCVGPKLSKDQFNSALAMAQQAAQRLKSKLNDLPAFTICTESEDLKSLELTVQHYRQSFKKVVILGTGGSSLGGQTVNALKTLGLETVVPELYYIDNIDPDAFEEILRSFDAPQTGYIVISKSGETAETLMQLLIIVDFYQKRHPTLFLAHHFTVVTEEKDSSLMRLAKMWSLPVLPHHPKIGGRFSVFSNVGMLPALIAGIDGHALRQGAASVLKELGNPSSAPITGAALTVGLFLQGMTTSVIMPYKDRLASFGLWYRQLWAESLGKNGKGMTPIRAMGTVDQHSQLQLYLDGPKDKMFTFLVLKHEHSKMPDTSIKAPFLEDFSLNYLSGRSMAELLFAEALATITTLKEKGCPVRVFYFSTLEEKTMGALLMHFMLETVLVAEMLEINAFDQPAVEQGKILTKQYMLSAIL